MNSLATVFQSRDQGDKVYRFGNNAPLFDGVEAPMVLFWGKYLPVTAFEWGFNPTGECSIA